MLSLMSASDSSPRPAFLFFSPENISLFGVEPKPQLHHDFVALYLFPSWTMWDVSGTVQVQCSCYQEHIEDKRLSSAPDRS